MPVPEPDYENESTAQELRGELTRREEEQREETARSLSIKERIQRRREEETQIEKEFYGQHITFSQPGIALQKRAFQFAEEHEGEDEDDLSAEEMEEMVEFMVDAFAELSHEDSLDAEFWGQFGFGELEELMEDVIMAGADEGELPEDVDAEEVRDFRGE